MCRDDSEYIACFTVASHGRLQTRRWISHCRTELADATSTQPERVDATVNTGRDAVDSESEAVMMQLVRDIVFRQIDSVPECVRQPPQSCLKFVVSRDVDDRLYQTSLQRTINNRDSRRVHRSGSPAPPVPPKPRNLPPIDSRHHAGRTCHRKPIVDIDQVVGKSSCEVFETELAPVRTDCSRSVVNDHSTMSPEDMGRSTEHSVVTDVHENHQVTINDKPSESLKRDEEFEETKTSAADRDVDRAVLARLSSDKDMVDKCVDEVSVAESVDKVLDKMSDDDYSSVTLAGVSSCAVVDTQCDSVSHDIQHDSVTCDTQSDRVSCDIQCDSVSHDSQRDSVGHDTQCDSVSHESQHDSVSRDTEHDSVSHDAQCDSVSHESQHDSVSRDSVSCSTTSSSASCNADGVDKAGVSTSQTDISSRVSGPVQLDVPDQKCVTDSDRLTTAPADIERLYSLVRKKRHRRPSGSAVSENITSPESMTRRFAETAKEDEKATSSSHISDDHLSADSLCCHEFHNVTMSTEGRVHLFSPVVKLSSSCLDAPLASADNATDSSVSSHSRAEDVDDTLRRDHVTSVTCRLSQHLLYDAADDNDDNDGDDIANCRLMTRGSFLLARCPAISLSSDCKPITQNELDCFTGTLLAYDDEGCALYVPSVDMKVHGDPAGEPWFYPVPLTSLQATILLSTRQTDGCFLVYSDTTEHRDSVEYSLSVCTGPDVLHYDIVRNVHGDLSVRGHDHSFLSLSDLVGYFQRNKSSLAVRLGRPLSVAHLPVTAGLDYDVNYELVRSRLSLSGNIIGNGRFGVICAGKYRSQPVAIKVSSVCHYLLFHVQCESRKNLRFSDIFSQTVGNF